MKPRPPRAGGLQGIGQREVLIGIEQDRAGSEDGIERAGESAGEDEFGGEPGDGVADGGFGIVLADASEGEIDMRMRLRQSTLEWAGFDGDGEGDQERVDHVRRWRGIAG